MQPPVEIDVWEFEWDENNERHAATHRVTPVVAEEVKDSRPLFFRNRPGRSGTHMMVGPDETGRFWTIILGQTSTRGRWRPITGWPSDAREVAWYNDSTRAGEGER